MKPARKSIPQDKALSCMMKISASRNELHPSHKMKHSASRNEPHPFHKIKYSSLRNDSRRIAAVKSCFMEIPPRYGIKNKYNAFFDKFSALFRFIIYSSQNQFK